MDSRAGIMVVDDDPGIRVTLQGIIEDEGYDVVGAIDGYQAIRLARETNFALIFMDVQMPGIDGVETCREIRAFSPESVVVMMTGFTIEDLVKRALEEGAYTVLSKPVDPEEMLALLQSITG